jgi:hypothetical protein
MCKNIHLILVAAGGAVPSGSSVVDTVEASIGHELVEKTYLSILYRVRRIF